jgi:tRNA dimethylallyltransferase
VIAGPTGSGKSRLAVAVAQRLGGEVVGCDALQVYRGFDAATAKPSVEDRRAVRHWLVDVADPRTDYSLARFIEDADRAIADISGRGLVPVIAGGTGMYLRGLLKGIVPAPARDAALRDRLRGLVARYGSKRLHRFLRRVDAASAARVPPEDTQRIVRALELALASDTTWSAALSRHGTWEEAGDRYAALKVGIDLDRELLSARLSRRVDAFFSAGLLDEVRSLLAQGVPPTANAFKGIGYRQALRALDGPSDPVRLREEIVVATRQYAKRQRTWFRKEPGMTWLDGGADVDALTAHVAAMWTAAGVSGGAGSPC